MVVVDVTESMKSLEKEFDLAVVVEWKENNGKSFEFSSIIYGGGTINFSSLRRKKE